MINNSNHKGEYMGYEKIISIVLLLICATIIVSVPFISFSSFMLVPFETAIVGKFLIFCVAGAIFIEALSAITDEDKNW